MFVNVAAHQCQNVASTPLEEWCFAHNSLVDQAAARAQWDRPPEFWTFYTKHVRATQACRALSRAVQRVLLRVSQIAVSADVDACDVERDELGVSPDIPEGAWRPVPPLSIPGSAVRRYGDAISRQVMSWFWQTVYGSRDDVVWVSQFQLYVDFMLCGELAPVNFDGWRHGNSCEHLDMLNVPFQRRTRWLCKVLKECLKHAGQTCQYKFCRPSSDALYLHTGCLPVPWPKERLAMVDAWFLDFCPGGVRRSTKMLEGLPMPKPDSRFPGVLLSST